jgi:hypothetical protein
MTEARKEPIVFVELHTRQVVPGANPGDAFRHPFRSVVPMESSIPLGMTCDAWRRWRCPRLDAGNCRAHGS